MRTTPIASHRSQKYLQETVVKKTAECNDGRKDCIKGPRPLNYHSEQNTLQNNIDQDTRY